MTQLAFQMIGYIKLTISPNFDLSTNKTEITGTNFNFNNPGSPTTLIFKLHTFTNPICGEAKETRLHFQKAQTCQVNIGYVTF